jgi:phospholipid/cholesterol/gamma-HCH transport system ATP-binding protein
MRAIVEPASGVPEAVLVLDGATLVCGRLSGGEAMIVDMKLDRGELVMVHNVSSDHVACLADACCGLLLPAKGRIRFLGGDWTALSPDLANARRGRIGRTFAAGGWLAHLSLLDNLLLRPMHHTRQSVSVLRSEAESLALHFGLPGLPMVSPERLAWVDLQRAACIRAFLGGPALVLLEDPTARHEHEILEPLINAVRGVCRGGGVVIWFTNHGPGWPRPPIPWARRYRMIGRRLIELAHL